MMNATTTPKLSDVVSNANQKQVSANNARPATIIKFSVLDDLPLFTCPVSDTIFFEPGNGVVDQGALRHKQRVSIGDFARAL